MSTEVLADDQALRVARRRRVLDAMEVDDLDALLLGREANARYVAGAQRLWTAGTRPFGPGCVLVRATGGIHLVSTWDEGIPEDIPHNHLFGITWNPGNLLAWLKGIEGLEGARRVGTDSLTPRFAQWLAKILPSAELVDAEPALQGARRIKTPEELGAIRSSIGVAQDALAAARSEIAPGVSERHLAAVFMEAMARRGVTTPATQRVAWISSATHRHHQHATSAAGDEDLVAIDAGVVAAGYTGEVGRTWPASPASAGSAIKDLYLQAEELWSRLLGACRPGASCRELLSAYATAGHAPPPFPIANGLGLGFDTPVVTGQLPSTAEHERLDPGMVLALTAYVVGEDGRAVFRKEAVHVAASGPEVLTSAPCWEG